MTDADLKEIRAALIQMENTLETYRACVIRVRKVIERQLPSTPKKTVTISPQDSLTGYTTNQENGV